MVEHFAVWFVTPATPVIHNKVIWEYCSSSTLSYFQVQSYLQVRTKLCSSRSTMYITSHPGFSVGVGNADFSDMERLDADKKA